MRLVTWLWRCFRPVEGRLEFFLLLVAVLGAALGGIVAGWVPGSEMFWHAALVGVLLGRALGRTQIRGGWAAVILATAGAVYGGWSVIHLTSPLWAALGAAWYRDWPLALTWLQEVQSRLAMLSGEFGDWLRAWVGWRGEPASIVSLFLLAQILWAGAVFAGWSVVRGRRPLVSLLPLSTALSLSVFLGGEGTEFLLLLMACVVMMTPVQVLRRQEQAWETRAMPYSEEFRFDVRVVASVSAILFLATALAFPNIQVRAMVDWAWQQITGPRRVVEEVLGRTFPGAHPGQWGAGRTVGAVLPREHLLGDSPVLGQTEVMEVVLDDPPPTWNAFLGTWRPQEIVYWRGTVYGDYVEAGWKPAREEKVSLPSYAALGPPERAGRRPLRQEYTLLVPHGETLYAAGEPYSIDQAVTVRWLPDDGDLIALEGRVDHYQVLSLIPQVTASDLATAPTVYSDRIEQVYLALPDSFSQRVMDLAQEVTKDADSPYARALALESYLRTYPYNLHVARPPEGRDMVEYFLFDLQRGYCDYFASAMVVMARSVGIPARLAAGYVMGRYDPQRESYVVAERDAHTWPELYFPGYGWIPFEPTSGRPRLGRATDRHAFDLSGLPSPPKRPWWVQLQVEARLIWLRWRWWGLAVAGVLGAAWVGRRAWRRRMRGLSAPDRVAVRYFHLRQMAARLGVPVHSSDTPAEFAVTAEQILRRRRPYLSGWAGLVQGSVEKAMTGLYLVTSVYEQVSYAPVLPDAGLMRRVWREGWRLHWWLWQVWVLSAGPEDYAVQWKHNKGGGGLCSV